MTMTFDQAMDYRRRQLQGWTGFDQAVLAHACDVIARGRNVGAERPPPYQALCTCGSRYGAHRVNDFACPNKQWRPGNGRPQWLEQVFARAA